MHSGLGYSKFRAPQDNQSVLFEPSLTDVPQLVASNLEHPRNENAQLFGHPLQRACRKARKELLDAAAHYTHAYHDVNFSVESRQNDSKSPTIAPRSLNIENNTLAAPVFMTGHQPELFHPGVWLKNFGLSWLASQHKAIPIHLLIDNDVIKHHGIRIPAGSLEHPHIEMIPLDRADHPYPYEDCPIQDMALFASFFKRVSHHLAPLVSNPILKQMWPWIIDAQKQGCNLGESLSRGRHRFEATCGLNTLEVPLSHVCRTHSFHWFANHLLADLPRFWKLHNELLATYRQANRIRSQTHPVADLRRSGDHLESPFWIWKRSNPTRRPLYVRPVQDGLELTDQHGLLFHLPLEQCPEHQADDTKQKLERDGIRIRPRVLITTLYARLLLSDLFVHGIGGAKYDQLTDLLIQQFFGLDPPGFLTLTGTYHLPFDRIRVTEDDVKQVDRLLREFTFHPEQQLDEHLYANDQQRQKAKSIIAEKHRWIHNTPTDVTSRQRHEQIVDINRQLQTFLVEQRQMLERKRTDLSKALDKEKVFSSREYSFCLFPENSLPKNLLDVFVNTV